ncbi:Mariner Mos1 transposase [Eumeta japonica]|uniref:Mariner Mos1 transposase n=1 Tax=Eumeta variegata TaxID=151549 RepID=A0A4C1WG05_EUMVA|nr:Mariner Mos1 transposase [Eumeta japonica]
MRFLRSTVECLKDKDVKNSDVRERCGLKEDVVTRVESEAYNEAALSERTCRERFQKFKKHDFDVEDKYCSGCPKIYEDAELEELLKEDSSQTQKELAFTLHDKIILLHDNARQHVAVPVKNYLKTLDWEVLPQPSYAPDIVVRLSSAPVNGTCSVRAAVHIIPKIELIRG